MIVIKFFKYLLVMIIAFFCITPVFSINYAQEVATGIVVDKNSVMLKEPKITSQMIGRMGLGQEVFIEENKGKWYKVSTKDGKFGWIHSECILIVDEEKVFIEDGIVNTGLVDVYEKPETQSDRVGELGFLTKVTVIKKDADWYELAMGDETIGWVPAESVITSTIYPNAKIIGDGSIRTEPSNDSKIIKNLEKNHVIKIIDFKENWCHVSWEKNKQGWIYSNEIKIVHKDFIREEKKKEAEKIKEETKGEAQEKNTGEFDDIIENATYLDGYSATAYDLSIASCGKAVGAKHRGFTRTGMNLNGKKWEDVMIVAVDPREIPLGSRVLILFDESDWRSRYNGVYLAADTGGGIKGKILDIYLGDIGNQQMKEVRDFGKTKQVKVYILN